MKVVDNLNCENLDNESLDYENLDSETSTQWGGGEVSVVSYNQKKGRGNIRECRGSRIQPSEPAPYPSLKYQYQKQGRIKLKALI